MIINTIFVFVFFFRDSESMYEVMAVSIENLLKNEIGHRQVREMRDSYKERRYSSSDHENTCGASGAGGTGSVGGGGGTGSGAGTGTGSGCGQWDSSNTTNSSVQESVERNREYYENLRKCYDPDPVIISQVIPERGSKSEESTPDIKKGLANFQQQSLLIKLDNIVAGGGILKRKFFRRIMTAPNFTR